MKLEFFGSDSLNIVELNTTGDNENYIKCDIESQYLHSEVFNLFTSCFENANKLYEFFGATKYNARKIVPLRNELLQKMEKMEKISSLEQFEGFIGQIFLGQDFIDALDKEYADWKLNWEYYRDKLIEINKGLIEIAEKCIEEQRVLWVIGY